MLGQQEDEDEPAGHLAIDEEQITEHFRHLFWTRLLVINGYETGGERKWPLGPDIIEECQAVADLQPDGQDEWKPLFDPFKFNEDHGPLTLDDYRLEPEELRSWAERAVRIRESINERAE